MLDILLPCENIAAQNVLKAEANDIRFCELQMPAKRQSEADLYAHSGNNIEHVTRMQAQWLKNKDELVGSQVYTKSCWAWWD